MRDTIRGMLWQTPAYFHRRVERDTPKWLHLNISRADFGTVCRGRNLDECASNGIRTRELYILLD